MVVILVDVKCISGIASESNFDDPNEHDQDTPCNQCLTVFGFGGETATETESQPPKPKPILKIFATETETESQPPKPKPILKIFATETETKPKPKVSHRNRNRF